MTTAPKLNIFQRLVRRWDLLHPYNAAQILKIAGKPDIALLRRAWHDSLDVLGLGRAHVEGNRFRFQNLNGDTPDDMLRITTLPLTEFISQELNRPFDDSADIPFRPFIIEDGDAHFAGVVYHHWVADSASIRLLLREWFVRTHDHSQARREPLKLADGGYWKHFGPHRADWRLAEGVLSSARWTARFKRVRRIEETSRDFSVRFKLRHLDAGFITKFHRNARAQGVKVHDVLLAAIAEACDRFVPLKYIGRRQDMALGTIVDLRPLAREDLSDTFGLFLGFTSVICRPRDLSEWPRLIETIAKQSQINKETGVPQASPIRMLVGLTFERMMKPEKVITFYRKRVPLAGGISNINLNTTWAKNYHPQTILDYIRVSPTGPMMPLVFTTSTLGDRFNFGFTYRSAIITDDLAEQIADSFQQRIESFANAGS